MSLDGRTPTWQGQEKRPHVVPKAEVPVRRAEKLKFSDVGPKLRGRQFDSMEGRLSLFGLPDEYRTFLRKYNGGVPDSCTFDWFHRSGGPTRLTTSIDCSVSIPALLTT